MSPDADRHEIIHQKEKGIVGYFYSVDDFEHVMIDSEYDCILIGDLWFDRSSHQASISFDNACLQPHDNGRDERRMMQL